MSEKLQVRKSSWGKPFWEAAREGKLVIQQCPECGKVTYPPRLYCPGCLSPKLEWLECSGRGKVYSFSVAYEYPPPRVAQVLTTPYVVALVDLEEGPRMITNLVDCDFEELQCEMAVEAVFDQVDDEFTLIKFRPVQKN